MALIVLVCFAKHIACVQTYQADMRARQPTVDNINASSKTDSKIAGRLAHMNAEWDILRARVSFRSYRLLLRARFVNGNVIRYVIATDDRCHYKS